MSQYTASIQALYVAYFNRPADPSGLAYWEPIVAAANGNTAAVSADFAKQPEYKTAYAGMSPDQIINQVYLNLFGRTVDSQGLNFWSPKLALHLVSIDQIVTEVVKGASGNSDGTTYNNRVLASVAYTDALNADVNLRLAYSNAAAITSAKNFLNGITTDASLTAAIAPAALAANLAQMVIDAAPVGPTFTLTTGIDTGTAFIGTSGNDSFNAVGTTIANALNALDSIDGGAGNNTLNVVSTLDTSLAAGAVSVKNIQTANITDAGAVTLDTTGWTGLKALNVSASTGAGAVTAAATTAVTEVNTLAATVVATTPGSTTIDGGSTVSLTATGATSGTNVRVGDIVIGGTTAATGAVTVTATERVGVATSSAGNISVLGGTDVAVTQTVNATFAVAAAAAYGGTGAAAAVTAGNANEIVVNGATGAVNVVANTNTTSAAAGVVVNGAEIDVKGGSTITVTANAGTAAADANTETINLGAVKVTGDAATSSVSVTQTAALDVANGGAGGAAAATAAVTGVNGVTAVAASAGVQGVAAVTAVNGGNTVKASAASGNAAVVTDGAVTITDKNNTSTATSSIKTVTLANYGDSTINGSALTTLNLSGTAGKLTINNGASAGATNTTLTLNVNGLDKTFSTDNTIADTNNEIKTLNIVTGAASSTITGIKDTGLTALNVSGSSTLTLTTAPSGAAYSPSLATIAVSGAAGFNADLSGLGATLTSFTTTSSGQITAILDAANQTFVGSTGKDVITISVNPTKTITGGSGVTDQLVLANTIAGVGDAGALYTAVKMANVTGFESLGIKNATVTNVSNYDMHNVFTGYGTVELISAMTGKQTITGAADGTKLLLDVSQTAVEFDLFNASTTGVANVTLAKTTSSAGITVGTLTLNDSNADGIAIVNITSNTKSGNAGTSITNTITTLADTSMSTLNISGAAALAIGTVSLGQPGQAVPVGVASLTINDNTTDFNNTGSVKVAGSIVTLTDDTLGQLSFTGSNNFTVGTLNDNNAVNLTISNTGLGNVTIGTLNGDQQATTIIHNGLSNLTFTGSGNTTVGAMVLASNTANLNFTNSGTGNVAITGLNDTTQLLTTAKLTLTGNIALGTSGANVAADAAGAVVFAKTSGMTIAAGTDNAHLSLSLTGASAGNTDAVTVGNGNNYIADGSSAGTVNVTAGTGANHVDLSAGGNNATFAGNVTFGAHTDTATSYDKVLVSVTGAQASGYSNTITGVAAGDVIVFKQGAAADVTFTALTAAQQTVITADTTLAAAIAHAFGDVGGTVTVATAFQWAGDTYAIYDVDGTGNTAGTDAIVKIVGLHTVGDFGTVVGAVTIVS